MSDENQSNKTAWHKRSWVIILFLIFLFPVGLWLTWRGNWNLIGKLAASGAMVGFFAFTIINAPPSISLASLKYDTVPVVEGDEYKVDSDVYPYKASLTINGETVQTDERGKFSYTFKLKEGQNDLKIFAKDGKKVTEQTYHVKRLTAAEIAEKKRLAEEKARKEAEAKKKAEDEKAAQKAADDKKAADAASAKAKADSDKAAVVAKKAADAAAAKLADDQRKAAEEAARNQPKTSFSNGTFLVGTDIAAGTYKSAGGGGCYYERLSGTSGAFSEIIANGLPSGQAIITIAPSDAAFTSKNCGIWVKI